MGDLADATERGLCGVMLGREKSPRLSFGTWHRSCRPLYSLIESAKLAGVEPEAYLRDGRAVCG